MADPAVGASSHLQWVKEATWGTTPTTPDMTVLPFVSESIQLTKNVTESNAILGNRQPSAPLQGNESVAGSVSVEWSPEIHASLIWMLLGTNPTDAAVSGKTGYYTHTMNAKTGGLGFPSMSLEKGFTDIDDYYLYKGARVSGATFNVTPESIVTGDVSIIAASESHSTTKQDSTPTTIAGEAADSFSGEIKEGATVAAASAISTVTSLSLDIQNNMTGINVLGKRSAESVVAANLAVSGTMEAFFLNDTLYAKYRGFTTAALDVKFQNSDTEGNYIQFQLAALKYGGATPQIGGAGPINISMSFNAFYGTANMLKCIIQNKSATID